MTTSWTAGGPRRAAGRAAEQGLEPEVPILLHSEPLENLNQEGDITRTAHWKDRSDHSAEEAQAR